MLLAFHSYFILFNLRRTSSVKMAMVENGTDYIPVPQRDYPSKSKPDYLVDSRYWKSFKTKEISRQIAAVNFISFCPKPPHDFAITSSTRVTIYDGKTLKLKKTISKFKDVAYSGVFRSDGQIVAAGGETGMVQVFDAKSRKVLRQLKGHSRPVRMVRYAVEDKLHLMSGGDDGLVKWWDITMQDELQNLEGHKDYVRCGAASPSTANLWATGSYDHTVRLWDLRSGKTVLQLKHGKPIEDLVFFPSGGLLASAGGNVVKVWDILGGGRAVHVMESHQKTVMSLSISRITKQHQDVANTPFRLITASLDGYMKSFDVTNFKVTHSAKYPSPIRSMGISPSCTALAIGTQSGDLFIRQRKQLDMGMLKSESSVLGKIQSQTLELIERGGEASIHSKAPALRSNNYRYFSRGQNEKASKGDLYVSQKRKVQLKEYDNALKRFCHMEALSSVLKERDIERKLAVMDELSLRKRLIDAVSNLGLDDFGLLISFLSKYATNPKYARFLVPVANIVLNRRAQDLGKSPEIKHQLELLKIRVSKEVELQQSMQQLQGIIEPLIRASYH